MNANKASVGEGRLHPHRGEHARERRGARRGRWASPTGSRCWTSVAATGPPRCRRPSSGADVLGVDIASNLVAAGNARAEALGLTNLRFQEGDASDLHELDDEQFDLVVSIFGAMFAPKPFDVAKEMVRVTKPGGRIVMGNWIPNDPTLVAQILKISSSYSPPPPEGFVSPMTWGVEDDVIERFTAGRSPQGADLVREGHLHVQLPGPAVGAAWPSSGATTGRP